MAADETRSRFERLVSLDPEIIDILLDAAEMGLVSHDLGLDEDRAIARLRTNESFMVLEAVVLRQRETWMDNFARGMALSPNLIDQREVDEKRGYFKGAVYYTHHLPRIAERRLVKKESDVVTS